MLALIVDDKIENLYLLELILKDKGYKTISAKNGAEALETARKEIPDLIITDILMPVMDGFTLCREFKNDKNLCNVPFIFYTATYTDPKDEEFALSLGADRFLLKPKEPDDFIEIVEEVLNEKKKKNNPVLNQSSVPDQIVFKEYNAALIRKLEDKMLQAEQAEREVRKYNITLLKEIEEHKSTEKALLVGESKYRSFFENSMDAILLISHEGKIFSANPAACVMFGYSEEEFLKVDSARVIDITDPKFAGLLSERASNGKAKGELTMIRRDGKHFPAEISFAVFNNREGLERTSMIIRDITERKIAEKALNDSNERYKHMTNISPVGIFHTDVNGLITFVNPEWSRISGLSVSEAMGNGWFNAVHPEDGEKLKQEWKESVGSKKDYYSQYRFVRRDGIIAWVMGQSVPERNSENQLVGYIGTITDITGQKLIEEALKENERKYVELFDNAPVGYHELDVEGRIVQINNTELKMLGYTEEEMIGQLSWKFSGDEDGSKQNVLNKLKGIHSPAKGEERVYRRKDKTTFPALVEEKILRNAENHITGIRTTLQDITEHKFAINALYESEERFRLLFKASPDALMLLDTNDVNVDWPIVDCNEMACKMNGYTRDELIGKSINILNESSGTKEERIAYLEKIKREGIVHLESSHLHKDGHIFPIEISTTLVMVNGRELVLGIDRDISERKHAEDEIAMLAHSLRSVNECVSITDLEDKIIFVNDSFLKTYGYDENELIGKPISTVGSSNNPPELVKEIFPSTLQGGWSGELLNKKKNGDEFSIFLSTTVINDKEGKLLGLIGVANDITERKRTEQELIKAKDEAEQSNKLKTEFLAQMSHEIRTPMNAILSLSSLIRDENEGKFAPQYLECFDGIESAGQRLMRTVDLILNVSEMHVGSYEPSFSYFDLMEEVIERIKTDYAKLVKDKGLEINFISDVPEAVILGDQYSIYQIFANLIENAIMFTEKGSIILKVEQNDNQKKLRVSIEDTGIGMSEEFLEHIFQPFMQEDRGYTRKFEGNGLGLSLVKKYCDLNNIAIDVESKKDAGTKFTLTLTL